MKFLKALLAIVIASLALPASATNYTTSTNLSNYTADDVGNLTITGRDAFDVQSGGQITLNGSSSGASVLVPPASGGGTLTLPTGTTTLVGLSNGQSLSNKILISPIINSPVVTGPAPTACGATCSVSAVTAGNLTLLNQAAGSTVTLPAATGTGNIYKFLISVATTSAAEKILTSPTTDAIIGTAIGENAGTAKVFVGNASTFHSIQMPFSGSQPSGGFIGDSVVCTDVATATWACNILYQAGTTPTTPYSASTS